MPTSTPTAPAGDLSLTADGILIYPGPERYSGDLLTFDVRPENLDGLDPGQVAVRVLYQGPEDSETVAEATLGHVAFDGIPRARMVWAWDTAGLEGPATLLFAVDPDDLIREGDENPTNNIVTLTVSLLPADRRPSVERQASWATATTDCCVLHYLTGTAADRDLPDLQAMAERAVQHSETRLGLALDEPLEIYFISRVIAHGGYARDHMVLSYLDRQYAVSNLELTVRHETVHILDSRFLTSWSPSILREGLAVWVTGGHFNLEPIALRAAALLDLDWYVPLEDLSNDFYPTQHEIGYLEGAALIEYLVQTYGQEAFWDFYRAFGEVDEREPQADVLDAVLQEQFGVGLAETETAFLRWLEAQPPAPEQARDLQITVYFFDTVRWYQSLYDPTAYFLITWLPNPLVGEERGIEADFLRHPRAPENVALETMLIAARQAQVAGDLDEAEALLEEVNRVLDGGRFLGRAADYLSLVRAVAAAGYETQQITLEGNAARVWAIAGNAWPTLSELHFQQTTTGWTLLQ